MHSIVSKSYILFVFLFLISPSHIIFSQKKNPNRAEKYYQKALLFLQKRNFEQSILFLEKSIQKAPHFSKAYYQLALAHRQLGREKLSIGYFEKASQNAEKNEKQAIMMSYFFLCEEELKNGNYEKAKIYAEEFLHLKKIRKDFLNKTKKHLQTIEFALKNKKENHSYQTKPLSKNINMFERQYFPALNAKGNKIYLTVKKSKESSEDIFFSNYENGDWSALLPLHSINTKNNEGTCHVSTTGDTLFFSSCPLQYSSYTLGSCDLFYSTKKEEKWDMPQNLGEKVNSQFWESQPYISWDGKYLFFTSNRPGGEGGKDLWKSTKKKEEWQTPENMGNKINTKGNEISPFLYEDNYTFFFASDGHLGFGGYDLFQTQISLKKNQVDSIKNVGYPINDHKNQVSLFIKKSKGYYADEKIVDDEVVESTIYYFNIENQISFKKNPYHLIKIDIEKGEGIEKKILLQHQIKNVVGEVEEKITKGNTLFFKVNKTGTYFVYINAKGFGLQQKKIIITKKECSQTHQINMTMKEIKTGEKWVFNNIYFASNSFSLTKSAEEILQTVFYFLTSNTDVKIHIYAHTDSIGKKEYNLELSNKRALSVKQYLKSCGIKKERLFSKGLGEEQLLKNKSNEENRRVEFEIFLD